MRLVAGGRRPMASACLTMAVLTAGPAGAQDRPPATGHRPSFRVGHSYSSERALAQPATLTLRREGGGPWLYTLDAAILADLHSGPSTWVEAGIRSAAGSSRTPAQRAYGALVRAYRLLGDAVAGATLEYEADGGFDVQKTVLNLELTPVAVPAMGIGIPVGGLRWRPWLAAGFGNALRTDVSAAGVEDDAFFRAYGRIEASYLAGRLEAGLEATTWLVEGAVRGTSYVKAAAAFELYRGVSLAASAGVGRQPPRFVRDEQFSLGVGFRWPPPR